MREVAEGGREVPQGGAAGAVQGCEGRRGCLGRCRQEGDGLAVDEQGAQGGEGWEVVRKAGLHDMTEVEREQHPCLMPSFY